MPSGSSSARLPSPLETSHGSPKEWSPQGSERVQPALHDARGGTLSYPTQRHSCPAGGSHPPLRPPRPCHKHAGHERPGAVTPRVPLPRVSQARIRKGGPRAPSYHHLSLGPHPGTLGRPTQPRGKPLLEQPQHGTFHKCFMVKN